jgi:glycosyltransferase involved in cell wall biosynthesis
MIVTVVTPTLNALQYLGECIKSAKKNNSRIVEVEHIIVDGGSTDGTVELARQHGLRVLTGKDKGIFDAINKGSLASSGELLGFLGADDVLLDGALDAVVRAYRESGRRWVVGGIRWIDENGTGMGGLAAPPSWMTRRMHVCLGWNPIMHMSTYLSRDFFIELGGFDIDYRDSGDYDMFARALSHAPFRRLARPVACFRQTGFNNSRTNLARTRAENARICANFGPASQFERQLWRGVLKGWFNGRNPAWLLSKIAAHGRVRLGYQQKVHVS